MRNRPLRNAAAVMDEGDDRFVFQACAQHFSFLIVGFLSK